MKKKQLSIAILLGVLSVGIYGTTEAAMREQSYELDKVLVQGERYALPGNFVNSVGTAGILGDRHVLDIPFSQVTITKKSIEAFSGPNQPLDSVLANVPAVRQAGSILHNDYTIRGFRANGTSMYVNGVHGMLTQFNMPMAAFEGIEVLAGPNAGLIGGGVQYESTNAGGIVSLTSKKAGEQPMTRYKQTFSGRSSFGEYIDISNRFGKDKEWGIRVNGELLNGETAVVGANMKAKGIYVNIDHQDTMSKTNLLVGYRDIDILKGQRWFKLGKGVTVFPKAVEGSRDYSFDGMHKGAYGMFLVLNHEQRLDENWKVFFNGGINKNKLDWNVMGKSSAYTIDDNDGNFQLNWQATSTPQKAYYAQFGATGKIQSGEVEHKLTIAADKAWRNREGSKKPGDTKPIEGNVGTANLYTGVLKQTSMPESLYDTYMNNKTSIWGVSVVDEISYDKWGAIVGVHYHEGKVISHDKKGKPTSTVISSRTSPTYALMYKPNDNVTVYGSHSEYFDTGEAVGSGKNYVNEGEILPPAKTRQNEIGVKYIKDDMLATLALFDIKQANNFDKALDNQKLRRVQDGEVNHKGVEVSLTGRIAPQWNGMLGVTYMDATLSKTAKGLQDGAPVSGQAKWTGVASVEYEATENLSLLGRAVFTGSAPVRNAGGKLFYAPAYTVFDLGATYKTMVYDVPTKLSLMVYNVFDKNYWMVSRGDNIYVGNPRTITLTAQFDF